MTAIDDGALLAPATAAATPPRANGRPTFSVILAAWEVAATLGDAVGSALAQTAPPHEVVVVDDGSTQDLAGPLARFGDQVRLIRIPHRGASAARNAAAADASGEFVAILDADDTWEPGRLERLGDLAVLHPGLDLLTTDAWYRIDGERSGRFYDLAGAFPTVDQRGAILGRNFLFGHVAVRRSRWSQLGGFAPELQQGGDWDFWLRLIYAGCLVGCVGEPLADYTIHSASLSADRPASLMARVVVLDRAARMQQLTAAERTVLAAARGRFLRRARVAGAEYALLEGDATRRRACLAVVTCPGVPVRQRLMAGAATLLPGLGGRYLRRRRRRTGHARSERRFPTAGRRNGAGPGTNRS